MAPIYMVMTSFLAILVPLLCYEKRTDSRQPGKWYRGLSAQSNQKMIYNVGSWRRIADEGYIREGLTLRLVSSVLVFSEGAKRVRPPSGNLA